MVSEIMSSGPMCVPSAGVHVCVRQERGTATETFMDHYDFLSLFFFVSIGSVRVRLFLVPSRLDENDAASKLNRQPVVYIFYRVLGV